jgi:D-glucosaminate-6-phosphate ammonia-lyase
VHMDELMEKVGQRLAELTGAEWGYICAGCAAALTEITAACMAGADPEKMARLPESAGMKNEVIIQKAHRNSYDRSILLAGAQMVEVSTIAELRSAFSERTAMLAFIGDLEGPGQIAPQTAIEIAHAHGIPVLVDAAAQRPDVPNRYLQMGADAVLYSGGKCLRGPQSAGLVLGRKDLLWAAFMNAAPHHGVARPMKAGKEEIMGLLAAVEAWVHGRDHEAEWRAWESYLETIRAAVAGLPSLQTTVQQPGMSNHAPTLRITWDPAVLHCTPEQAYDALLQGEPPVIMHRTSDGLTVMPYMMELGDAEIAATRLHEVLSQGFAQASVADTAPAAQVAGDWQVEAQYVLGRSMHAMSVQQDGLRLSGTYRSQYARTDLQGQVLGDEVRFSAVLGYQANMIRYAFSGHVEGNTMRGTVSLGEYGKGAFTATRVR